MPEFVRRALADRNLLDAYDARPWYQRNDYLGGIARAKREDTVRRRLDHMLAELAQGDVYMKMPYRGGRRCAKRVSRTRRRPIGAFSQDSMHGGACDHGSTLLPFAPGA